MGILAFSACPKREIASTPQVIDPDVVRERLAKEANRRQRAQAVVKARMQGIQGLFASANLDLVVEKSSRVHIALQSFFGQPSQIFATDGVTMSVFDTSGERGPQFYRGNVNEHSLSRLIPVTLWPHDAVNLFLGSVPAAASVAFKVEALDKGLALSLREPNDDVSLVELDDNETLLRWRRYSSEGTLVFDAQYNDFETLAFAEGEGSVVFAKTINLVVPTNEKEKEARVVFELSDVALNPGKADDALFVLNIPEGYVAQPLP